MSGLAVQLATLRGQVQAMRADLLPDTITFAGNATVVTCARSRLRVGSLADLTAGLLATNDVAFSFLTADIPAGVTLTAGRTQVIDSSGQPYRIEDIRTSPNDPTTFIECKQV